MEKGFEDLLDEFYEKHIKDKVDISRSHLSVIVRSPFEMLKEAVESFDNIHDVRLKYLGKFYMNKNKLKHLIKTLTIRYERGKMPQEKYDSLIKKITTKISEYDRTRKPGNSGD